MNYVQVYEDADSATEGLKGLEEEAAEAGAGFIDKIKLTPGLLKRVLSSLPDSGGVAAHLEPIEYLP